MNTIHSKAWAWIASATVVVCLVGLALPSFATPRDLRGEEVYVRANCSACHGGQGYGGAGPRFRNAQLLSADTYVVGQILIGRGIMPAFKDKLSDEEIAAVATYIRTSWGNDYGSVSPARVAEIRESLAKAKSSDASQPQ